MSTSDLGMAVRPLVAGPGDDNGDLGIGYKPLDHEGAKGGPLHDGYAYKDNVIGNEFSERCTTGSSIIGNSAIRRNGVQVG
jgi:hypothetical protein